MSHSTEHSVNKVAQVNFAFWIMKICATTVGETGGDLLSMTLDIGYAASSILLVSCFIALLIFQLRSKAFHPALYWGVIVATSTAGTTISDFIDRSLGLGYAIGSAILVSLLVSILAVWRWKLGSLSVDHISDRRAEIFYWFAILISNTLGTALGDFLADTSGLGYLGSNLLISSGIFLVVLGWRFTAIPKTALFWAAFVLTRPFGATMGDLLTKNADKGGLGFGTWGSTAVLSAILIASIAWTTRRDRARA